MNLELFANLIDALGKVAGGLKTIATCPKLDTGVGWPPYLPLENAYTLGDVRAALRRGDLRTAVLLGRVITLTPSGGLMKTRGLTPSGRGVGQGPDLLSIPPARFDRIVVTRARQD